MTRVVENRVQRPGAARDAHSRKVQPAKPSRLHGVTKLVGANERHLKRRAESVMARPVHEPAKRNADANGLHQSAPVGHDLHLMNPTSRLLHQKEPDSQKGLGQLPSPQDDGRKGMEQRTHPTTIPWGVLRRRSQLHVATSHRAILFHRDSSTETLPPRLSYPDLPMPVSPSPVGRRTFLVSLGAAAAVGCAIDVPKLATADDFGSGTASPGNRDTGASQGVDSGMGGDSAAGGGSGVDTGGDSGDIEGWEAECEAGFEDLATCERTPHAGEGPYFVDGVEERSFTDIRGTDGQKMVVDLRVYEQKDGACTPIEGARVDIWHCDEEGVYDMSGANHCRAQQRSAPDGTVCFEVLRPPAYGDGENRLPEHLHLNVFIDGDKVLTTQIQFEDDPVVLENPPPVPELVLPVDTLPSGRQRVRLDLIFNRDFPPDASPPEPPRP